MFTSLFLPPKFVEIEQLIKIVLVKVLLVFYYTSQALHGSTVHDMTSQYMTLQCVAFQ